MPATLLTGATGTLGRALRPLLEASGHTVRVLSRKERPLGEERGIWRRGDLFTGLGVDAAVEGADVIVHCASGRRDLIETKQLVSSAAELGTAHLVYISIVGVDRIPMSYYRSKLGSEKIIERSGLEYTILRATQFHNLVAGLFRAQRLSPVLFTPDVPVQPIDMHEVARGLAGLASELPAGRVPDMGGPEVRSGVELAEIFLEETGRNHKPVPLRLPGKLFRALEAGYLTSPGNPAGGKTFREFLREKNSENSPL